MKKRWRELSKKEKHLIEESVKNKLPVSDYASRNAREYYAEAYTQYQLEALPDDHIMHDHFKNLERVKQWLQ